MKQSDRLSLMVAAMFIVVATASCAFGATALDISKPPVGPVPSWTGPTIDPHAEQGQWFKDNTTLSEEVRPYEFYDNVIDYGGGNQSYLAIKGLVGNIQWAGAEGSSEIVSFWMGATITNDLPGSGSWVGGTNSHGESGGTQLSAQPLRQVKLTASFAVDIQKLLQWKSAGGSFSNNNETPYKDMQPYINALNDDQLAWYCWTPGNQEGKTPYGDYLVPTWDFYGDIPVGQTASRSLHFDIRDASGGTTTLSTSDPRWQAIFDSHYMSKDLFSNRTTSLKISNWLDTLAVDDGTPYPLSSGYGSDVSVFFVPEPSTLWLLALCGLGLAAYRRWGRKT